MSRSETRCLKNTWPEFWPAVWSPAWVGLCCNGGQPLERARTTNVSAIIYDFKAVGGALRKQRIDDWWQPAKPEPEPKATEPEIPDWMFDPSYWGMP